MMDLPERIFEKILFEPNTGCWLWAASRTRHGYGKVVYPDRSFLAVAHRVVYTILVGQIPDGLTLDHLCRVRHCVNPSHLEPVTMRTNLLRGIGPSAQAARKTHCPAGHPYAGANLISSSHGRECRTCRRARQRIGNTERMRAYRARRRQRALGAAS